MAHDQYDAYCHTFHKSGALRPLRGIIVPGIGILRRTIVKELIHIPFSGLGIIIDVKLLLLEDENVPSVTCMP